ncbi:MAG: recombinase family protein [Dehalococcoidales bacterium]|nr:recombinase family protein [Dehalococcoidales bacterium]
MTKAAIYCRVSTDDQEKEGTSLQTQREACLAYCQQKGYQVVRQFSETYSGLTLERPELIKLRNLIRDSDIDLVVVYCLDRLSRNATHGVILRDDLDKHHVALESVTEDIDKSPLGEAITYLRGTFAQIEAEKIRERTMRGKLARLKEGKLPHGTGKGIYGYDWNKQTGHRTINELESKVVQKVFTMMLQGSSFYKVALELNKAGIKSKSGSLWHPLTIKRIVTNESYTGKTYSGKTKRVGKTKVVSTPQENWILLADVTPQIIPEEMFKQTQEAILNIKQSRPIKKNAAYLFTGFIRCSKCGSPIGGTMLNGKYRYYQCRGARPTATRGKICNAGYIKADRLESEVWKKVVEMASSPTTILFRQYEHAGLDRIDPIDSFEKQIDILRKKLKTYSIKEKNFYSLLQHESVTKEYVLESVDNLKRERLNDERLLKSLLYSRNQAKQNERFDVKLTQVSESLLKDLQSIEVDDSFSNHFKDKRSFLEHICLELVADPESFKFSFRLGAFILKSSGEDSMAYVNKLIKEFEQSHPETNAQDLINLDYLLPEDSPLAKMLNPVKKDLVTIEQTSASPRGRSCPSQPGG